MSSHGSNSLLATIALLIAGAGLVTGVDKAAFAADGRAVERGAYLATIGGCHDCHTPKVMTPRGPVPDTQRLLSGHPAADRLPPVPAGVIRPDEWSAVTNHHLTAWAGPWGVSYAANLTPDASGLANWTADMFIQAMRNGKHMGNGRPILPPMPWPNYATMPDEDLHALFAYLKSLPPIRNAVPAPLPPAPGMAERP